MKLSIICKLLKTLSDFNFTHIKISNFYFKGVGVYISRVEEGSVAERSGLRPGDSILEVNGTPFTGISHEEALKVSPPLNTYYLRSVWYDLFLFFANVKHSFILSI